MKIVTVVGARPQFIKAAALSRVIRDEHQNLIDEVIVHTGQHFDENMSGVFFEELDIPKPKYNLEISGGNHGYMTGRMLESIEKVLLQEKPDWVLIYGDTNSTLAAALAAVKLHIPVAHVEAGLRSFNMRMPEEVNRILSDRVAKLLLCPTELAVKNLEQEGIIRGVHNVGDVMYDAALFYRDRAKNKSKVLTELNLQSGGFILATCHRAENTDDSECLREILSALSELSKKIPLVLPLHPRTKKLIEHFNLSNLLKSITLTEPLPFLDMVALEQAAKIILTDSGGVQKEAYFYGVPCITMRNETEWMETVTLGANQLVGASKNSITKASINLLESTSIFENKLLENPYGDGNASRKIIRYISN